jgi:3-dehydroquinate synthetase
MNTLSPERTTHLRDPGMVVMDVTGTRIRATVCGFDELGKLRFAEDDLVVDKTPLYDEVRRISHPELSSYFEEVLLTKMVEMLRDILSNSAYEGLPVAISFSGQVSPGGEIYSASSIFGETRPSQPFPLKRLLLQRPELADREILVLNNISAAAWRLSVDQKITRGIAKGQFLVLHVGSGFGSKIFNVGQRAVLLDDKGLAGELGHVDVGAENVLRPGVLCNCGAANHLASYFLPEGLRTLIEYFSGTASRTQMMIRALRGLRGEEAPEFIERSFRAVEQRTVARNVIAHLASLVGKVLSPIILAVGIDRIILKGSFFFRLGKPASTAFDKYLLTSIRKNLKNYITIPDDFIQTEVPWKAGDSQHAESYDRKISLGGLVVYASELYRAQHRVTSGYFDGYPCYTLSCANDIRYPVIRNDEVLEVKDSLLDQLTRNRKTLVVIDERYDQKTRRRLARRIVAYFKAQNRTVSVGPDEKSAHAFDIVVHRLDPARKSPNKGENKTPEQVIQVIEWCHQCKLPRDGLLVGVGGGVILDIVGFAAQQFRRMVSYIRIPTTLIGQVDAGVGIKVGVNYKDAKNLIGGFHPPLATVNAVQFLYDLDDVQMQCGIAEILKMGIVADGKIVEILKAIPGVTGSVLKENSGIRRQFQAVTDSAIRSMMENLQRNIVERDLKRLVDFGHTFSPTIESLSSYAVPHGYAVAIDIYLSCYMARYLKGIDGAATLIGDKLLACYRQLLQQHKLLLVPFVEGTSLLAERTREVFDDSINKAIQHRGGNLNLVVPLNRPGQGGFIDLDTCKRESNNDYCAITCRNDLFKVFASAVRSLSRQGTPRHF